MTAIFTDKQQLHRKMITVLLLLLILLPTFGVYSQLAGHTFVSLDDPRYVSRNPRVLSGLKPDNVRWAFQTLEAEFWHPLTWLSYMLDTELFGTGSGGYLLTNMLLHLFNCALIFIVFRRLTGRLWESWLIGLIFAIHPLHVEPVAWVSGRKELLCAAFWLLSLLAYGEFTRTSAGRWYAAVMIFFVSGLMAKSMIVTLPFLLLLLDYWPLERTPGRPSTEAPINGRSRGWLLLIKEKIPLFAVSAAGIAITLIAQQQGDGLVDTETLPVMSRLSQALAAYAVYLKKSIWPGALTPLTPIPADIGRMAALAVPILLIITFIVVRSARRRKYLFTGWLWFLGTLVPVIGIVKVGEFFIADRYMYIPLTGILIMVVFSLKHLIDRLSHRTVWLIITPVLIAGAYGPATWFQIQTWRDSETLYRYAISVTDDNFLAHHALGHALAERKDKAGAIEHFARAAAIRPDKAVLWIALGKALVFDGQWQAAADAFDRAARLKPLHPAPRFYQGCILAARGEPAAALAVLIDCLEKARGAERPVDGTYTKVMDFYENGLYYEKRGALTAADRNYRMALALMNVDMSRRQLSRLVVGGYDKWLTEISGSERDAD